MTDAIVICTTPGREAWLRDCIDSIHRTASDKWQVLVLSDFNFELGKIRWLLDNTTLDRWFLLHDTIVVHSAELFAQAFAQPASCAISDCPVKFGMYLGVYTRSTLNALERIPQPNRKDEAIFWERQFADEYCAVENVPTLCPEFTDANAVGQEERHGRNNLVLQHPWLTKYKGTWSP